MATYECPWIFKGKEFESEDIPQPPIKKRGEKKKTYEFIFVYLITDLQNGKKYIGQKMFHSMKTYTEKKVKKKRKVESDWKSYFSSSVTIQDLVKTQGSDKVKREILYICCSKGQANYLETKLQFELNCLENQDIWYNGIVNLRCKWDHLRLADLVDKDEVLIKSLYTQYRPTF